MCDPLKCCNKRTKPMKNVDEDEEVEEIYKAIRNDNTEDTSFGEEENVVHEKGSQKNEALSLLRLLKQKYSKVEVSDRLRKFLKKNDDSMDTLLHTAALFNEGSAVVERLLRLCPDLITIERTGSYKGQTALHITIAKEKILTTEAILKFLKKYSRKKEEVLSAKAKGSKFKNNIMMGETALSVAVLTLNTELVDLLLDYGASIDQVNTKGDTVIHTLIKYAEFIPDKTSEVIQMLNHLNTKIFERTTNQKENAHAHNDNQSLIDKMWFGENKNLQTPLKLTVSAGLIDIFQAIMNLKNVFFFPSNYDGFYDTQYYDITEIDSIAQYRYTTFKEQETLQKRKSCQTRNRLFSCHRPSSIIENLSTIGWKKAKPFVDTVQIKMLISRRWHFHRYPFYIFAFIHVSVMFLFTTSIYYRKYVITECNSSQNDCQYAVMYAKVTPWVLLVYSAIVIISEIHRLLVLRQIWWPNIHHNNSWYRASLILFASGLFVDAFLYQFYGDSNDIIFIVLILGCWFLFFFLKWYEKFAIYTVLFQKVIMGDLLRFGWIIGIEFAAYSYAMYIVLRGNGDVAEFSNFENTTLTMFSYMLGLHDLSILDNVESDVKRLVAVIYVLFIISTYILLLNTLIAMMSGTSSNVFADRNLISRLQRDTVVLFLDGFFPWPNLKWRLIDDRPVDEISTTEVTPSAVQFRRNRVYIAIKIDKIGKLVREKEEKKNLTLKDIKFELFNKDENTRQGKNADKMSTKPPSMNVNDNVRTLIESEESIQSSNLDIEELNKEDSVQWKSLDIEYQA